MEPEKRDTVVVENNRSASPMGWIIALVVIIILALIFFSMGGFGLFNGSGSSGTNSVDTSTPDTTGQ